MALVSMAGETGDGASTIRHSPTAYSTLGRIQWLPLLKPCCAGRAAGVTSFGLTSMTGGWPISN